MTLIRHLSLIEVYQAHSAMLEIPIPHALQAQPEAGPSRASPVASFPSPAREAIDADVVMDEISVQREEGERRGASEEAAQLLLSISSTADQPPMSAPGPSLMEKTAVEESATSPTNPSETPYPCTPPDYPQNSHFPPLNRRLSRRRSGSGTLRQDYLAVRLTSDVPRIEIDRRTGWEKTTAS